MLIVHKKNAFGCCGIYGFNRCLAVGNSFLSSSKALPPFTTGQIIIAQIWWNMMKYYGIWWNIMEYDGIWLIYGLWISSSLIVFFIWSTPCTPKKRSHISGGFIQPTDKTMLSGWCSILWGKLSLAIRNHPKMHSEDLRESSALSVNDFCTLI